MVNLLLKDKGYKDQRSMSMKEDKDLSPAYSKYVKAKSMKEQRELWKEFLPTHKLSRAKKEISYSDESEGIFFIPKIECDCDPLIFILSLLDKKMGRDFNNLLEETTGPNFQRYIQTKTKLLLLEDSFIKAQLGASQRNKSARHFDLDHKSRNQTGLTLFEGLVISCVTHVERFNSDDDLKMVCPGNFIRMDNGILVPAIFREEKKIFVKWVYSDLSHENYGMATKF